MRWCISFCPVMGGLAEFHWPPQHDVFMTEINFLNEIFMSQTLLRWFVSTSSQVAGVPRLKARTETQWAIKMCLWKIKLIYELISDNMSVCQLLAVCGQQPFRQSSNNTLRWTAHIEAGIFKHKIETFVFTSIFLWAKLKAVRWIVCLCIAEVLRCVNYICTHCTLWLEKWEQKEKCCTFIFVQCNCKGCWWILLNTFTPAVSKWRSRTARVKWNVIF